MDKIILDGMRFYAYHGVTKEEREEGQEFIVDVEIFTDTRNAAQKDNLDLTIDYDNIYHLVARIVNQKQVNLIETLAADIAESILTQSKVASVTVRVKKPSPPIKGKLNWAGVEITRQA